MDALQVIAPLIGVVLGSGLSGLSTYIRERKERKRTIALALTDLLEVRHHIVAADFAVKALQLRVEIPASAISALRNLLDQISPLDGELHTRYNNAVSLIAGVDPVLAFTLRSKNAMPTLVSALRRIAASAPTEVENFEAVEKVLWSALVPNLDAAVLELAAQHSFSTSRKVKRLVKSANDEPPEVAALLKSLVPPGA